MARRRSLLLMGFGFALLFGVAVYFRIGAMDDDYDDLEALRRQFDRANMEAMDESAEWRMKYDGEAEMKRQCHQELIKVKAALAGAIRRSEALQKENIDLRKQVESLTNKFESKCNCNQLSH